jgi:hypothetical protein
MPAEAPGTVAVPLVAVSAPAEVALLTTQAPTRPDRRLHKQVRFSIALSAVRCVLTYVLVPALSPLVGPIVGHDPRVAVPLSVTALVFDARAVRNVWRSDLRWRWAIIGVYTLIIAGLTVLLIGDLWKVAP